MHRGPGCTASPLTSTGSEAIGGTWRSTLSAQGPCPTLARGPCPLGVIRTRASAATDGSQSWPSLAPSTPSRATSTLACRHYTMQMRMRPTIGCHCHHLQRIVVHHRHTRCRRCCRTHIICPPNERRVQRRDGDEDCVVRAEFAGASRNRRGGVCVCLPTAKEGRTLHDCFPDARGW